MLCALILYISDGTYSLKSTPNDSFFEKLFMAILFTLRVFAITPLRGSHRRNIFRFSFWCRSFGLNPGLTSNKPIHNPLEYGDFYHIQGVIKRHSNSDPSSSISNKTEYEKIFLSATFNSLLPKILPFNPNSISFYTK